MTRKLITLIFLLLAGCSQNEPLPGLETQVADTPAFGDTYIVGSIGDASTLLPVLASDSSSSQINSLVYSGLVKYDGNLQVVGDLAESWEISKDGLTITFHLRKGVKWHDGAPFTSADVLYTYQVYIDPETPTSYAEAYRQVTKAETPDDYTFRVSYDQPYAPALMSWGFSVLPKHLLEGDKITESDLGRHPVGTGPYRFVSWEPGEKIVLEANRDYFAGSPYLKRYVFRIIPDTSTQFLELQTGGLDYMSLTPLQYKLQTDTLAFRRLFNKYRYLDFGYTYLGYNLRRPLFKDRRVRQALTLAIDKKEIIDGVLLGYGQAVTGPYKSDTWVYNKEVPQYAFDPQRARDLLDAAGWVDSDGDGIRDKDGRPFSFTIVTNQGNDLRSKAGEIIQQRFKEVGVDVKLRIIEWATFLKEFINPGNFDATILGWSTGPEPDQYNIWHSSKTGPRELNFIGYQNAEVDDLLERGRRIYDQSERKKIYDRLQVILAEDQPYTFLFAPESLQAVASRVHGIEPKAAGIGYNFEKWYVPQQLQKFSR